MFDAYCEAADPAYPAHCTARAPVAPVPWTGRVTACLSNAVAEIRAAPTLIGRDADNN